MKSILIDAGTWKSGATHRLAVFSDPHIAIYGNNDRLKRDLDEAVSMGCRLCFNGDIADFIYHMDKRYAPELEENEERRDAEGNIIKVVKTNAKFDQAVEFIIDLLMPYKEHIDFIGYGNHETAVIKRFMSDPITRICKALNCQPGAYRALVRYTWAYAGASGRSVRTLTVYYHHGGRGVATQNKGIIALRHMYLGAEADVYIVGHGHRGAIDGGEPRDYLDNRGNCKTKIRKGMQVPGYQERESPTGTGYEDKFYQTTCQGYGIIEVVTTRDSIEYNCILKVR